MEALLVPSREDGRCPELLDAGAEAWACEALLTAWRAGVLHFVWVGLVSGPWTVGAGTGLCVEKSDEGFSPFTWDSVVQSTWVESPTRACSPVLTCQPSCPISLSLS